MGVASIRNDVELSLWPLLMREGEGRKEGGRREEGGREKGGRREEGGRMEKEE